jgi:hypothetical protein
MPSVNLHGRNAFALDGFGPKFVGGVTVLGFAALPIRDVPN